jgi:hypothetical protein
MNEKILLNTDWLYLFSENGPSRLDAIETDLTAWIPLARLQDWVVTASVQSGADWFRREFVLEEKNHPVQYLLQIDRVPESVSIFVNGTDAGYIHEGEGCSKDVSRLLAPGRNVLALQLFCETGQGGGGFGDVALVENAPG